MTSKPYIISISGKPKSGKSCFAEELRNSDTSKILVVQVDWYKYGSGDAVQTLPDAFDLDLMTTHISRIRNDERVLLGLNEDMIAFESSKITPIVVVEGLYPYNNANTAELYDMKIYLDCSTGCSTVRKSLELLQSEKSITDSITKIVEFQSLMEEYENNELRLKENVDIVVINNGDHPLRASPGFGLINEFIKFYLKKSETV